MGLRLTILAISLAFTCAGVESKSAFKLNMGDEARINAGGKEGVLAAIDQETWREMLKSSAAKDDIANAQRMMAGLLFQIPDRTRVRVIDYRTSGYGQPLYRIRVLEGPEVNKAGFVDATFLSNSSSDNKANHGMRLNQVTVPSTDVAKSIEFYKKLGLIQIVDSPPKYARFVCRDGDATFSVHHYDELSTGARPVVYFECDNIDETVAELKKRGVEFDSDPVDQPWLWREAYLRDPDGNVICLYFAGENRLNPPWRMKSGD